MSNTFNILDGSDQTVNASDSDSDADTSATETSTDSATSESEQVNQNDETNSLLRRLVYAQELLLNRNVPDPGR